MLAEAKQAFSEGWFVGAGDFYLLPLTGNGKPAGWAIRRRHVPRCNGMAAGTPKPARLFIALDKTRWVVVGYFYNVHGVIFKNLLRANYKN